MKNLKLKISEDVREGILNGRLKRLEELIIDEDNYSNINKTEENNENKKKLIELLYAEREKVIEGKKKLEHPESLNHLGDFIKYYIQENKLTTSQLIRQFKFDTYEIDKIIKNTADLTTFSPDQIANLISSIKLNIKIAINLISKSIDLFTFKPTLNKTLARYSSKDGQELKDKSMNDGLSELLLKAAERKPFSNIEKKTFKDKGTFLKEVEHCLRK